MALSDTWLKANHGKIREKAEEKPDRDAMSVRVTPKGKITFQVRFRHEGKHARIDIGSYPAVSLKEARERTAHIKALIEQGIDPRVERQLQKHQATAANLSLIELFGQWNDKYLARSKRSHTLIRRAFENHVFDQLGSLPADRLTMGHWLSVLEPLAEEKPAAAAQISSKSSTTSLRVRLSQSVCCICRMASWLMVFRLAHPLKTSILKLAARLLAKMHGKRFGRSKVICSSSAYTKPVRFQSTLILPVA